MKRILIALLTLSISLFGYTSVKKIQFESGISIYGQIGYVDVELRQDFDNNTYEIKATATSIGAVKYLTSNRKDIFISEGKIKNGVYIPFKFTKQTIKDNYEKVTSYIFDYEEKTVFKTVFLEKLETVSTFDVSTFGYKDEEKLIGEKSESNLKLYPNDYLSLYLNLKSGKLKFGKVSYVDKKNTDTLIYKNTDLVEVQKHGGDDTYSIVIHHDDQSLFFQKIESIGVSFYGDAYIKKVSEKTNILKNN
ncbi:MAG: hypothetical protein ACI9TV_000522 [Sulfurimonas sp.]|jgi:hypothetical protein|uniref:hypothetical protein n=1 Tax=Sulfurimonas sp. TaxID=2022749 RepID=UPI0039E6C06C